MSLSFFINEIFKSNLFNFVVMLFILEWIIKKFNISERLENGRRVIEEKINESISLKEKSLNDLYQLQENNVSIQNESLEIINNSSKNAELVCNNIKSNALRNSEYLKKSIDKIYDSTVKSVNSELTDDTINAVVKISEDYLLNELEKDSSLHQKFINDSIESLNGVKF